MPVLIISYHLVPEVILQWQPPHQRELGPILPDVLLHDPKVALPEFPGSSPSSVENGQANSKPTDN